MSERPNGQTDAGRERLLDLDLVVLLFSENLELLTMTELGAPLLVPEVLAQLRQVDRGRARATRQARALERGGQRSWPVDLGPDLSFRCRAWRSPHELVRFVVVLIRNAPVLDPSRLPGWSKLTSRQRQVALLILQGLSNGEIARGLGLALSTVKAHVGDLFTALGVRSRVELLARVSRVGPAGRDGANSPRGAARLASRHAPRRPRGRASGAGSLDHGSSPRQGAARG